MQQKSLDFFFGGGGAGGASGQKKTPSKSSPLQVAAKSKKRDSDEKENSGNEKNEASAGDKKEKKREHKRLRKAVSVSAADEAEKEVEVEGVDEDGETAGKVEEKKGAKVRASGVQLGKAKAVGVVGVGDKTIAAAEKHKNFNAKGNAKWESGKPVPYSFLAEAFDRVSSESGRLIKTEILKETFRTVIATTPEDLLPVVYLSANSIAPAHEGIELGIGDASIIKAIAESTGRKESHISKDLQEVGDLGVVAQTSRSTQATMFQPKPLMVRQVFADFRTIAMTEGEKSVERKRNIIKKLLTSSKKTEATYVVRALQGKLRIGASEQTVLTSLAQAVMWEKKEVDEKSKESIAESQEKGTLVIKQVFSECPCFDEIVPALLEYGVFELPKHCKFTVGVPVRPMLAKPTLGVQEVLDKFTDQEFTCEFKYDGERAQIHFNEGKVKIFSRNAEDNTSKYPDVIMGTIPKALKSSTKSVVLDGEIVAYDKAKGEILPFQVLQKRKRKDVANEEIEVQVCYFAFDCLFYNETPLLQSTLIDRRKALQEACQEVEGKFYFAKDKTSSDVEELQNFLDDSIKANTEGLIVKTVDSTYEPSQRSLNWLKLKKDYMDGVGDSIDVVVVGAWYGKGKRTGNYGTFLLACYNDENEEFETIGKVGTGFSDEDLDSHFKQLKEHVIESPRPYYKFGEGGKNEPEVWFDTAVVWEIKVADWSLSPVHKAAVALSENNKGISFRFPRFLRIRDDRTPTTATTSNEIYDLYQKQFEKNNED